MRSRVWPALVVWSLLFRLLRRTASPCAAAERAAVLPRGWDTRLPITQRHMHCHVWTVRYCLFFGRVQTCGTTRCLCSNFGDSGPVLVVWPGFLKLRLVGRTG